MPKRTLERKLYHITDELASVNYHAQSLYNDFGFENENSVLAGEGEITELETAEKKEVEVIGKHAVVSCERNRSTSERLTRRAKKRGCW